MHSATAHDHGLDSAVWMLRMVLLESGLTGRGATPAGARGVARSRRNSLSCSGLMSRKMGSPAEVRAQLAERVVVVGQRMRAETLRLLLQDEPFDGLRESELLHRCCLRLEVGRSDNISARADKVSGRFFASWRQQNFEDSGSGRIAVKQNR